MKMPPEPPRDYDVGKGKTPVHSRYKPGQSGNPKGRRKGALNVKTELEELVNQAVTVNVGGRKVKMTSFKAMLWKNYQKALAGDARAFEKFMALLDRHGVGLPKIEAEAAPLDENEEEILADYLRSTRADNDDDPGEAA